MSGSAKPSPDSGRQVPVELDIPAGMFFEGRDYNPLNEKTMSVLDTQRRVVRHRAARKSDLHQVLDDLSRLNAGAHAADRQGNLAAHWDSLQSAAARLSELVMKTGKQIDAAESRYEEFFESPPPVPPAGAVPPPAPAGTLHLAAPAQSPGTPAVTNKPAGVQLPKPGPATLATLAERVRRSS